MSGKYKLMTKWQYQSLKWKLFIARELRKIEEFKLSTVDKKL